MPGNGCWMRAWLLSPANHRGVCGVTSHPTWTPADGLSIPSSSGSYLLTRFCISTWRPWERWEEGAGLGLTLPLVRVLLQPLFGKRTGREFPR